MTDAPIPAPFGAWDSPITTAMITRGAAGLGQVAHGLGLDLWMEYRPWEAGRAVLVGRNAEGRTSDLTPTPFNPRSRVHEYGGDALCVGANAIWFVDFPEQGVWRLVPGKKPRRIAMQDGRALGEPVWDGAHERLILVAEDARPGMDAENSLVALSPDGRFETLVSGSDFVAFPRPSPDGRRLAWLEWDHPDMPWDAARLCVAALDAKGRPTDRRVVAGGNGVAAFQPEWDAQGRLIWADDRSGWWTLYREDAPDQPLVALPEAEFGLPLWQLGMHVYRPLPDGRVLVSWCQGGVWQLGVIGQDGAFTPLDTDICGLQAFTPTGPDRVLAVASWVDRPNAVVALTLSTGAIEVLRSALSTELPTEALSRPRPVTFVGAGGLKAHGFYYPPRNDRFTGPPGEAPPLIVKTHGGPTGQAGPALGLKLQYWTSRGFAVLDVNYSGSTGYGRAYRDRLKGRWGLDDVADAAAGALAMVEQGLADRDRLIISGGSAGGYTVLCALTFTDVFRAGCSSYGIGDLATLARDTHKFESRYLDSMVGPWPERADLYRARSPIHHVDRLNCPVIFLQGADDKVVPPNQAEAMVDALDRKGLPVAYILFEGEGHGFRKADTVTRALQAELGFYGRIFGFTPAGGVEPPEIRNLPAM